eukprot:TRINITY_DN9927_c0_g1_i1.p2 TRINITY_DN9927_c0_g1~~TRINITY_DN9927_c0_g1_i1.p2  ORF type:complete len:178 (-),score=15.77 TRINITY_DN9927_c0_g1_i1:50-583(-)
MVRRSLSLLETLFGLRQCRSRVHFRNDKFLLSERQNGRSKSDGESGHGFSRRSSAFPLRDKVQWKRRHQGRERSPSRSSPLRARSMAGKHRRHERPGPLLPGRIRSSRKSHTGKTPASRSQHKGSYGLRPDHAAKKLFLLHSQQQKSSSDGKAPCAQVSGGLVRPESSRRGPENVFV